MTAWFFSLRSLVDGRPDGLALVCTEVRYASIRWPREFAVGIAPDPLPATSVIGRTVSRRRSPEL
jgi:hypothetical protein